MHCQGQLLIACSKDGLLETPFSGEEGHRFFCFIPMFDGQLDLFGSLALWKVSGKEDRDRQRSGIMNMMVDVGLKLLTSC